MSSVETREYRASLPRIGVLDEAAANGLRLLVAGFQAAHSVKSATATSTGESTQHPVTNKSTVSLRTGDPFTGSEFDPGSIRHPNSITKCEMARVYAIACALSES
jgi:hypothetical protein